MELLKQGDKVALVACSNGLSKQSKEVVERLINELSFMGLEVVWSPYLYAVEDVFSASAKEKAKVLMDFYKDQSVKAIFDISGGDLANEVLSYLDYEFIKSTNKMFFGYSDLTTIVNGIYAKTGNKSGLYQVRNIVREEGVHQREWVKQTLFEGEKDLVDFEYEFIQGDTLEGEVIGVEI